MTTTWQTRLQSFAPVPLRLVLGFGFLYHGYPKLFTAEGYESFVGMLKGLSVPAPGLSAYLIGGLEFFGGILLMLGVAVRMLAVLGTTEMVVAAMLVHWPAGFNFIHITGTTETGALEFGLPGYEVNLLYIAGLLSLLMSGAGRLSLPSVREQVSDEATAPIERVSAQSGG